METAVAGRHRLIVAGMGPGAPEYMLPAAMNALAEATVLVGHLTLTPGRAKRPMQSQVISGVRLPLSAVNWKRQMFVCWYQAIQAIIPCWMPCG